MLGKGGNRCWLAPPHTHWSCRAGFSESAWKASKGQVGCRLSFIRDYVCFLHCDTSQGLGKMVGIMYTRCQPEFWGAQDGATGSFVMVLLVNLKEEKLKGVVQCPRRALMSTDTKGQEEGLATHRSHQQAGSCVLSASL